MSEPTKYEQLVKKIQNTRVFVIPLMLTLVVMAVPQFREGIVTIYGFIRPTPPEQPKAFAPNKCELHGEEIQFCNIVRTQRVDFVRINSITYKSAIDGQYLWLKNAYPSYKHESQALVSIGVEIDSGDKSAGMKDADLLCDVHVISLPDGFQKRVYFDMSAWRGEIISPGHPIERKDGDIIREGLKNFSANPYKVSPRQGQK